MIDKYCDFCNKEILIPENYKPLDFDVLYYSYDVCSNCERRIKKEIKRTIKDIKLKARIKG